MLQYSAERKVKYHDANIPDPKSRLVNFFIGLVPDEAKEIQRLLLANGRTKPKPSNSKMKFLFKSFFKSKSP
jgi:hypothetical protein